MLKLLLLCCLILTVCFPEVSSAAAAAARAYWVVFGGHLPGNPVHLMKIDSTGKILVQPKIVLKKGQFGRETGAAAIGHLDQSRLHLWRWGKDRSLYHAIIDKTNLTTGSVRRIDTLSTVDSDTLQVTQRNGSNFLIYEGSGNQLQGITLDINGLPAGTPWHLIPNPSKQNDEACISADGEFVVSNRHDATAASDKNDSLYSQRLAVIGTPRGVSHQIAAAQDIEACDVSNKSRKGQRWVAYIVDHGTKPEDILVLQKISSRGRPIGKQIVLNAPPGRNQDDQNVAIDPRRRFVLFTMDGEQFGCGGKDLLFFLRLSSTGQPVNQPKLLAGCGFVSGSIVNLDILLDS